MRILVLGLDKNILNSSTSAYRRVFSYSQYVDWYGVLVPNRDSKKIIKDSFLVLGSGGSWKIIQLCRMFWKAQRIIKEQRIDVITSQDTYYVGILAIILGKITRVGVEIQVHGLEKFNIIRREIAEFVLKRADSIRVVGSDLKKYLISYFDLSPKKFIITPIFVDWQAIRYKEFDYRIRQAKRDHFIFLVVARLVSVKNVEGIIRAFYHVHKDYAKSQLVIVGDGPLKTKLMGLVRELGLEEYVVFVGWVESVIEYYRGSDCGVFFSKSEGYGISLIEALACQLPVITTKVGIAPHLIKDGRNGLFVDIDDLESLERMMKLVIINKEMLEKMKKNTRVCLEQLPSFDRVMSLYLKSWRRVVRATLKKQKQL